MAGMAKGKHTSPESIMETSAAKLLDKLAIFALPEAVTISMPVRPVNRAI